MTEMRAPWTSEQQAALNRWQFDDSVHPFTCGMHLSRHGHVRLVAIEKGWRCPIEFCSWEQDWAHDFMAAVGEVDDD